MLNHFDNLVDEGTTAVRTYGLRYITRAGNVKEIFDARKKVKGAGMGRTAQAEERGKFRYNLKFHGAMLLYDENADEYQTVKVAHMVQFRPYNSRNWLDIKH